MDPNAKKKVVINNVKNRFLFIPPSVEAGLESEAKIDDFKITQELGEGSFGKVLKVTHKATGKVYAIKAIDKRNKTNQQGKPYFRREIEIMYKIHHPNAVKLYTHFEDDVYCYFVMELASKGNLYELMQKRKTLDKATVVQFMRELISSIYYLHHMDPPIIHRDIKPENILLSDTNQIKLTDFGWSNYIDVDSNQTRSTYCGTPLYLAPEMIKEIGHDAYLDIWCLGVLMFELITGTLPFTGKNIDNLSGNILKNKIVWPSDIGFQEKDLLSKILRTNPNERLGLTEILAHPYFTDVKPHPGFAIFEPKDNPFEDSELFLLTKGNLESPKKKNPSGTNLTIVNKNSQFDVTNPTTQTALTGPITIKGGAVDEATRKELALYKSKTEKYEQIIKELEAGYLKEKHELKRLSDENEGLKTQLAAQEKNKNSLIADLEEKENARINDLRTISELKDKLLDKDYKNKALTRSCIAIEEKNKLLDEENERLKKIIDDNDENLDNIKSQHLQTVSELQQKLLEALEQNDERIDNRFSIIRDSISEMTTINPTSKYAFGQDANEDLKQLIRQEYDEKIEKIKAELGEKIDHLQKVNQIEKEKFNQLIKEKDEELKKLVIEDRKAIKDSISKQYEKALAKSDLTLKIKDSEIEKLTTQLKKYDKILEINGLKKK